MPLSAVVNGQYFCVHGGISQSLTSLEAVNQFDRKIEVPFDECLFSDLLWADPAEEDQEDQDYVYNKLRNFSFMFGKKPTNDFL